MGETVKIVSKVFIKGKIEDVWREITKTDELQKAMFNTRMHTDGLRPGGQIRMRTANGRHTAVAGEVLAVDAPHRLSHTMMFTQYEDPTSTVTYELKEVEGGVEFTLTAEAPAGTKTAKNMKSGAGFITKNLKAIIEQGKPSLMTRVLYVVFGLTAPLAPKSTLSENWPLERSIDETS